MQNWQMFALLSVAGVTASCSSESECERGSQQCACAAGDACFADLVCQTGVCVPGAADGGSDGGPDPDSGASDSGPVPDAGRSDGGPEPDAGPVPCVDYDLDGRGSGCALGSDCDDEDRWNWMSCATCEDADDDFHWVGCDLYDFQRSGPDCDDTNYNAHSTEGCANCDDGDNDGYWVSCDLYGDDRPGPDCDDSNANVGVQGDTETCNGLSESCTGEVDHAPADAMCPAMGESVPAGIATTDGWACAPPSAGEDGCVIKNCQPGFFDQDGALANGCECTGTPTDCQ